MDTEAKRLLTGPKSVTANSFFLAASNGLLIVTALAFWAMAKRLMPTADYNQGLVLINAILLIGSVASLNAHISIPAAIARRGARSTALVTRTLVATGSLAAIFGLGYHLASLAIDQWPVVWTGWLIMPLACAGWLLFTLQDGMLVGVGRSELVPTENLIYGIVRLAMLGVIVQFVDGWTAMTIAWVGPLLVAIPVVLGFIYNRALPLTVGDSSHDDAGFDRAVIQADAAGSIFSQALFRLVPLVAIVIIADQDKVAALSTAWLVFATSDLFLATIGTSLSIADPADRESSARDAMRLAALVSGTMAIVFIVAAPLIMTILLGDIGRIAVPLVRLIGIALFVRAPLHVVLAELRILGRARELFLLQLATGLVMMVLLAIGLVSEDLVTVGICLVVSVVLALPIIWWTQRHIRAGL